MLSARRALPALLVAAVALLLVAAAAPAGARVALLATGTDDAALLDVATARVVKRIALPGPTTAVAVTRDGRIGFAAGGGAVIALDLRAPSVIGGGAVPPGGGTEAGGTASGTIPSATVAAGAPPRASSAAAPALP
ncbi:MAG TPA: hypothetical protein VNT03_14950, partial [Baekduia sp.]|nr:hypothetical protein [Baekduia sp.]